ncbi:140L [Cherax quadricarinatus iridovirus]|uniref:SWIB MDM2 domain-containing protein n=1 Tax=Shrimp hemocyte iridescent virus TaxID=2039780 RepID=A0A291B0L1_9VIRU|nr:140L [Cherax quadricarinatus iridovirus]YP_010084768.1 SWIB MDM2 domain-containing protein [Shrimp hemocyte iridescent virus]UPA43287.1 SWIB MDM2 domain-containing protein [Iridovirus CN01]ASZ85120.1 140L [Cherax quadricarinatus iridovirus]ATE87025.1 SWIB MDM2 domain-containing protein [Shrimp hemocyte iridescent virus]UPA43522.1 SWIB MDM2 domain-containing protein [Iridovirus CN01]UPA43719.1 SWIB MDM2 domain-containing protein [Iridovirus CN01]
MKKRNIEEEITKLCTLVNALEKVAPQKTINGILKQIQNVKKCVKPIKGHKQRNPNQNSGLLKPSKVSKEMCDFAGWNEQDLHSRVEITNSVCDYIRENNLQKDGNRKFIIPDQTLERILRWEGESEIIPIEQTDVLGQFQIDETLIKGKKKEKYFNNSTLRDSEGNIIAKFQKSTRVGDGLYDLTFDKDVSFDESEKYFIHIPLTYYKIQSLIGVHLL